MLECSTINTAMVSNVMFECSYWSIIINTIKLEKWCHVERILSVHLWQSCVNQYTFWPLLYCFLRRGMDSSAWVRQNETPCVYHSCVFHRHASLHLARVHLKHVSLLCTSNVIMCYYASGLAYELLADSVYVHLKKNKKNINIYINKIYIYTQYNRAEIQYRF